MASAGYPSRPLAIALASVVASILLPPPPVRAQVALVVPEARLQGLLAACSDGPACVSATAELVAELGQSNPEVPLGDLVSTVAAVLIDAYNDGALPPDLAVALLAAVSAVAASNGLSALSETLSGAVELALAGETIDAGAVVIGSASPT